MKRGKAFGFFLLGLATFILFLILASIKKISWKTFFFIIGSLMILIIVVIIIYFLIKKISSKNGVTIPNLICPPLNPDKILEALKVHFTQNDYAIPCTLNHENKLFYPYGSFSLMGQRNFTPGPYKDYIFELFFLAGSKKGHVRTLRVRANHTYDEHTHGASILSDEPVPLDSYKRKPREFPDVPVQDESNRIFQAMMGALDPDFQKSPAFQEKMLSGMMQSKQAGQVLHQDQGSDDDQTDAQLPKENVYQKPVKSKRRKRR